MEDKNQILGHPKALEESEREAARILPCSPDQPINQSSDRPIARSPDSPICSPDRPIIRSTDSERCRECLGAMAHRLAQPMTALRGGIELGLMGKRTVADYRALLEQSLQLADSMVQMIVSLRDLGESSAPGGTPKSVRLESTVTEVLAEMESLAQSQNLRLQLDAEGAAEVSADPARLREALQSLLTWIIQNSAGGGAIAVRLSAADGVAQVFLSPPRIDLQYLQIKMLEDITTPGLLFSHASKNGSLGWAINQRLLDGLGGKLEMLTAGPDAGCICISFPVTSPG
jgi:phosphoglycerate-specific signal transduction histidine kinase